MPNCLEWRLQVLGPRFRSASFLTCFCPRTIFIAKTSLKDSFSLSLQWKPPGHSKKQGEPGAYRARPH
ncbi:Uncharacterized protein HZ326_1644 [Fusarium oxysporum f. sp. albedinis]|nr:Uncharacterized protein HZ326_1644 [Fusarium oxysporum f. sp. albedinis]